MENLSLATQFQGIKSKDDNGPHLLTCDSSICLYLNLFVLCEQIKKNPKTMPTQKNDEGLSVIENVNTPF